MIEDFRDGTPAEYAAFYVLRQYIVGDIEVAAKKLLENGYDGEYIASCVFDLPSEFESRERCFEKALLETGLSRSPNIEEAIWLAVKFYLTKVVNDPTNAIDYLRKIVHLEQDWGKTKLFERPDCDAYFAEQKKKYKHAGSSYVGQFWGIENLYGIFYSQDDWQYNKKKEQLSFEDWLKENKERQRLAVIEEAKTVIGRFFSEKSDLPKPLSKVGVFL